MVNELLYQIALTLINGVGDVNAKSLLAYCGSASEIFKQKKQALLKIPGIGDYLVKTILDNKAALTRAEKEMQFVLENKITSLFFSDASYPSRLKYCGDSPILLYYKGTADLNTEKIIAVVGTRQPSDYGKQITTNLINDLKDSGILVVSGLAYGIDVLAHKSALDNNLATVGVVGHGLDRIYPQTHEGIAKKMLLNGGILTDFMSGTNPDAVNFPKRNRIVAGLCDALIMVESKRQGGSLITATIASSYNKDVFAFPGRAGETLAEGGNGLIKTNKAVLIEGAADLLYAMRWEKTEQKINSKKVAQQELFLNLTEQEKQLVITLQNKQEMHIDEVCHLTEFTLSLASTLLLQLEFAGLVKSLPGKRYKLV
jgi:DNA processing protein